MKTLRALTLSLAIAALLGTAYAQGLRPEIGRPLQQAGQLLKEGKAREALARVREAEAVSGRTPAENLTIDRMKAAAAQRAGDHQTAIQALEAIAPRVSGSELGQVAEQLAAAYAQQRNNAKANEWLQKAQAAGNNSASLRQLQSYLQSASGDYASIAREAAAAVAAAEQAGRRPDEGELLRLADAQQRLQQQGPYLATLERLVLNYPGKKDYWNAYLARMTRKPGFSDRFALDVMRLRLASGTLTKTDEYMEMAQLSLQAGLPAEAQRIIEAGYQSGALGTGAEAARHQRLRDLAARQLAEVRGGLAAQAGTAAAEKSGDALVRVGYSYVSLGEAERGIKMIQEGIAKGGLTRPEDAKLRLGMAMLRAPGQRTAAVQTLRSVRGTDGAADIARLWTIVPNNS